MRGISAVAVLFALSGGASAATAESETAGQFLLSMPARTLDPLINYCSESVPEIKDALLKERAGLIHKLTEAGRPLMEALESDPDFNAPVQESMRQEISKADAYALGIFMQQDPNVVCRTALANVQNATVDELRKVVEDTYRKYRQAGQVDGSE